MRVSLLLVLFFLWGCASNGEIDAQGAAEKEVKLASQAGLVSVQQSSKELVAMLCSAKEITQAKQLLKQHQVLLVKQSSPTILALSWSDTRSAQQVIQALQKSKTVFCGIESNQIYTTNKKGR